MTRYKIGDRVEILFDNADYASVKKGDLGTITGVHSLNVTPGETVYKVLVDVSHMPWITDWGISEKNLILNKRPLLPVGNSPVSPNAVLLDELGEYSSSEDLFGFFEDAHVKRKCECGATAVGIHKHSDYCPLYDAKD